MGTVLGERLELDARGRRSWLSGRYCRVFDATWAETLRVKTAKHPLPCRSAVRPGLFPRARAIVPSWPGRCLAARLAVD
jgi:hypothetical protein